MSDTTTTTKSAKPFCSLAYLAKSTVAINSSNDVRIVNAPNTDATNIAPSLAHLLSSSTTTTTNNNNSSTIATPTAKVNDRSSQRAACAATCDSPDSGNADSSSSSSSLSTGSSPVDVFGVLNEEQSMLGDDQIDGAVDPRRPWELGGGLSASTMSPSSCLKRIPPSLMSHTNGGAGAGGGGGCGAGGGASLMSMSKMNSLDCWDYTIELECLNGPQDLQLAAELGKTLLERNKELETLLKDHKSTIEEQEQEIVYLKKHTTALREVNDSRLKVYEQLEVGIQDLERANHRLLVENTSDKKHIKTLVHSIESLESRCEDLNKQLDETRQALSMERRKTERLMQDRNGSGSDTGTIKLRPTAKSNSHGNGTAQPGFEANTTAPENCSFAFQSPGGHNNANSTGISGSGHEQSFDMSIECSGEDNEEIIKLVNDLETTKKAFVAEQQRCTELEEQLVAIIQENQTLQGRIAQTSANEEMKSMHEELSILDEVRQGQMCSRCLRAVEDRFTMNDEQSSIAPTEGEEVDVEDRSLMELENMRDGAASEHSQAAYRSIKISPRALDLDLTTSASPNPYKDLVEKYEALLEVQRSSIARKNANGVSLAEEFQSSGIFAETQKMIIQAAQSVGNDTDYNTQTASTSSNAGDAASSCNGSMTHDQAKSTANHRGRTPTEFSEAETSSSGFSDETSNKSTQTENRLGSFLCTIGDGEACKFSIYDDVSPIESHFRNRPEYRELFKEIFAVLKKAAENKEEGDKLPLLDDTNPAAPIPQAANTSKVPPVTPANEELPVDFADDTQSIISSAVSEQSFAMSECVTKLERKTAKKHIIEKNQENKPPLLEASLSQLAAPHVKEIIENGRVLTPLKREPLEYLSVGVGIKGSNKKNRRKNRNFSNDRAESPAALPSPPKFYVSTGKKRRDVRPLVQSPMASAEHQGRQGRATAANTKYEWNGNSMVIYNRSINSPRGRSGDLDLTNMEYRPSTVSQDLHKLKKLDLSYAEVLRRADACKQHLHNQYPQQQQQARRRHNHK